MDFTLPPDLVEFLDKIDDFIETEIKPLAAVPAKAEFAGSAPANEDGSAPEGFDIKGNADSMKFHAPTSPWYGRTKAEVWFKTAEAAEAAGFVNAEHKND